MEIDFPDVGKIQTALIIVYVVARVALYLKSVDRPVKRYTSDTKRPTFKLSSGRDPLRP
jgi:hypothetical protein